MGAMNIVSTFKPDPRFTLPTVEQEDAAETASLLLLAVDRFREGARDALLVTPATRESYTRYQLLAAAWKAAERGVARHYKAAGIPTLMLAFTPEEDMSKHAPRLPAALEYVTTEYRAALSTVGHGGLIDASILDATRKALQHEIEARN